MKLDVTCMRYMSKEEFRVLTAVEMGMKNHELVPVELIGSIAKLKHGGAQRVLSSLLRYKLIAHDQARYNGYRLTYHGYDILALRALLSRGKVVAVGNQIGVGKESDIFIAQDSEGNDVVLKFHRLGRTSFRSVKSKRDYLRHRKTTNWLYLSRLAAIKEFAFMRALYANEFPTPVPLDQNRHVVLMSLVKNASPMAQIRSGGIDEPERVFKACVRLCVKLAEHGLIHCDFNEFNLMLNKDTDEVTLIDFPQMISTMHENANFFFDRDVQCLVKFFAMKQHYIPNDEDIPSFEDIVVVSGRLDEDLQASGYGNAREDDQALLSYFEETRDGEIEGEIDANGDASNEEDGQDEIAADESEAAAPGIGNDINDDAIIERFRARMEIGISESAGEFDTLISSATDAQDANGSEEDGESDSESQYIAQSSIPAAVVRGKVQRTVRQKSGKSGSRNTTKQRDKKGRIVRNTKAILDMY